MADISSELSDTAVAVVFVTALVGGAFAWAARCGQQFHGLEATFRDQVRARIAAQEERIGAALALVMQAVLPEILSEYLSSYLPSAPLTFQQLRRAAKEMEEDEDAADLVARRLVTQPVIASLLPGLSQALPGIAGSVSRLPAVDEAILRLRCYAGSIRGIDRRASRLAWRFGLQALALIGAVVASLAVFLGYVDRTIVVAMWLTVVAHGILLEYQLYQLGRDAAALPPILDEGAG